MTKDEIACMVDGDHSAETIDASEWRIDLNVRRLAAKWRILVTSIYGIRREYAAFSVDETWKRVQQMRARYGGTGTRPYPGAAR